MIGFDQQGHGRTPDTSRKMSYEQFADDAAALLRALKVERADVMGYSQGGGVALQLALRHPTLVNKLISLSATYRKDGWYPSVYKGIEGLSAKAFAGTPVETAFKEHTPDAKAFDAYLEKMKVLNIDDQNISDAQMRSISAKTMVIIGDADGVKPEHALAMFELRGGGDQEAAASGMLQKVPPARSVILPATSHIGISGESAVLVPMVSAFLDDVPPATPDLFSSSQAQRERNRPPVVGQSVDGQDQQQYAGRDRRLDREPGRQGLPFSPENRCHSPTLAARTAADPDIDTEPI